jgi:hypothetical protein
MTASTSPSATKSTEAKPRSESTVEAKPTTESTTEAKPSDSTVECKDMTADCGKVVTAIVRDTEGALAGKGRRSQRRPAVAIVTAAKPIAILRIVMLTPLL